MAVAVKITDRDLGWVDFFKRMQAAHSGRVKVGVLDDAKGSVRDEESSLTVAEYGAINEFGTEDGRIPSRSYLRSTFDEQRAALTQLGTHLMAKVLIGDIDVRTGLNLIGSKLAAEVKKKISGGVAPPNAVSTMLRKAMKGKTKRFFKGPAKNLGQALAQVGSLAAVKPLIDTGRLLGAVTWQIVEGSF